MYRSGTETSTLYYVGRCIGMGLSLGSVSLLANVPVNMSCVTAGSGDTLA